VPGARTTPPPAPDELYPGERLGLPQDGRGSLASWGARVLALCLDWAACMAVAVLLFGSAVLTSNDWQSWMILATFVVETTLLGWLAGGSLGQLVCRIGVLRLDRAPLGLPRAVLRAVLVALVLPALVIGPDRRGLHDMAAGTAVISRRDARA
jgi:uncharacterized RDD family membrane protein YckC